MFTSLALLFALSTLAPAGAVKLAPFNGRVNVYSRTCTELLDTGFTVQTVTPPLLPYATRVAGPFHFDTYGSNLLMMHEGPRHEVQATIVRLNSGEVVRSMLGPSRGTRAEVGSTAVDADQILMQVRAEGDSFRVLDAKHALSRVVLPTPARHYRKLEAAGGNTVNASPIHVTHPYFVASQTRTGRFGRNSISTRLVDWVDQTVVTLDADARYLEVFNDPVSLPAQKLAVVEPGGRTLRLISMDAFEQCLRGEGTWWSGAEAAPRFDRAPVIEFDDDLQHAFWLDGTTRLVTLTAAGVSIWDGTTGQRLDAISGSFTSVSPIHGQALLTLVGADGTTLYATDLKKPIETFATEANLRVFDRERNRTYLLNEAGKIYEVRRLQGEYAVRDTHVPLEVDPADAQIGAVETSRGTHLVIAGYAPESAGRVMRSYLVKAYALTASANAPHTRTFTVQKDMPSALAPSGKHLVFGIDNVRVAIVDLKRLLETEFGL